MGEPSLNIPKIAKPSLSGRRSLYIVEDMSKGQKFTRDNVRSIRPSYGLAPKFLPKIIGKIVKIDVKKGERMSLDLIMDD